MSLHVSKIKKTSGETTYRLRYWKNNKHLTIPLSEHPEFKSLDEALAFCKKQNAKLHAERHLENHAKGMAASDWKKRFATFDKDVEEFVEWYKEEAPNSWEASRSWIQNFVIPYFLGKGLNNPNLWHTEFEVFRRWLEKEAKVANGSKLLSYSSRIHIVKCLNNYIKFLGLHNKMDSVTSNVKCRGFKRSLANKRGKEDLIQPSEYEALKIKLDTSRDFFVVLMNTGMRVTELYSLQFPNIFKGSKDLDETLVMPFITMGKTIFGYIRLESQIKKKVAYRNPKTGKISRKPLKSKPKISPQFNRIIPITDPETWDILLENRRRAYKEHESRIHGSDDPDDYLVFNVDISEIRRDLRRNTTKTPHCCRHTFTTNTVRSFRLVNYGPELIKGITGHTSSEFEKYVHLGMEDENQNKKKKVENF
jgi:integrase